MPFNYPIYTSIFRLCNDRFFVILFRNLVPRRSRASLISNAFASDHQRRRQIYTTLAGFYPLRKQKLFYKRYWKLMKTNMWQTWWRHYVETLSASLAPCEGNPPITDSLDETNMCLTHWSLVTRTSVNYRVLTRAMECLLLGYHAITRINTDSFSIVSLKIFGDFLKTVFQEKFKSIVRK